MKAIYDIAAQTFDIEGGFGPFGGVLGMGFRNDGSLPVDLRGVASYGWILGESEADSYPKSGRLLSSALDVVIQKNLRLTPDATYTITFFVELHEGGRQEFAHEFVTGVPDAPFESWLWDAEGKTWVAPVDRPDDGQWVWDEGTTSWAPCPVEAVRLLESTDAVTGARGVEDLVEVMVDGGMLDPNDPRIAYVMERIAIRKAARAIAQPILQEGGGA